MRSLNTEACGDSEGEDLTDEVTMASVPLENTYEDMEGDDESS